MVLPAATGFLTAQTYENSLDAVKVIPEAVWADFIEPE